jgi:hypothetical protein
LGDSYRGLRVLYACRRRPTATPSRGEEPLTGVQVDISTVVPHASAGKVWRFSASSMVRASDRGGQDGRLEQEQSIGLGVPPASGLVGDRVREVGAVDRSNLLRPSLALAARFLGALSLLAVGAVHLQQYEYLYSSIPTIGRLFMLNFVGATVLGLGLLAPVERLLGRWGGAVVALLALGGVVLAATAFASLLVAERTPLFGFMEPGYDPPALMASRVAELATVGLLGSFLVAPFVGRGSGGRW